MFITNVLVMMRLADSGGKVVIASKRPTTFLGQIGQLLRLYKCKKCSSRGLRSLTTWLGSLSLDLAGGSAANPRYRFALTMWPPNSDPRSASEWRWWWWSWWWW